MTPPASGDPNVGLCVEQLRRAVPGGIGTYVAGLCKGLSQLDAPDGPAVTLLSSRPRSRGSGAPDVPDAPDPTRSLGFPLVESRLPVGLLTRAWDAGLWWGARHYSVVHASSLAAPPPVGRALVVAVHDLAWREFPEAYPARGRRWHEHALRRAAARAAAFVVPSEETRQALEGALVGCGFTDRSVAVVPHGSDHLPAGDMAAAEGLLRRLGVSGPFLLAVGTLEPRKNLERLFAAYALARRQLPEPWPLLVAGPTGWGGRVVPVEGVVLAGPASPEVLSALYSTARCVAYVPLREGFGLPVLEAMAAGTPVVSSRVPAAGHASLVVDPLDVEAISAGLLVAATDGDERERLVRAGSALSARQTWRDAAGMHVRVWRNAAGGRP